MWMKLQKKLKNKQFQGTYNNEWVALTHKNIPNSAQYLTLPIKIWINTSQNLLVLAQQRDFGSVFLYSFTKAGGKKAQPCCLPVHL